MSVHPWLRLRFFMITSCFKGTISRYHWWIIDGVDCTRCWWVDCRPTRLHKWVLSYWLLSKHLDLYNFEIVRLLILNRNLLRGLTLSSYHTRSTPTRLLGVNYILCCLCGWPFDLPGNCVDSVHLYIFKVVYWFDRWESSNSSNRSDLRDDWRLHWLCGRILSWCKKVHLIYLLIWYAEILYI